MLHDLRYGLRMLRKSPGFTAVAMITLALGIGANTAIFSVVRAVLLPPLPFANPSRLVQIQLRDRKTGDPANWVAVRDVADWRARNHSFESIGAYGGALLNLTAAGQADALYGARVSADMLPLLGVPPLLGRFVLPADDQPGHDQVIVLSYDLWQHRFSGDPSIVGRAIRLTGQRPQDYTVVGVMPRGFNFPLSIPSAVNMPTHQMAYWIPFGVDPLRQSRDGMRCLVVGRLKPGVSPAQAQADLDAVAARIERESPQTNTGVGVRVVPFAHYVMGRARPAMLIMLGAVGLLVLIACANIANLLLARVMSRRRETGIRLALGADRRRLLRQWITESLLLATVGGGAGLLLAAASLRFLIHLAPQNIPRLDHTHVDGAVLAFTLGLSLLAGLLFGAFPAWLAAGADPQEALAEGGARSTTGPGRSRARDLLIVAEVAVSVLLTIGAGLLVKSFVRLLTVDPGFHADRVVTAIIVLPQSRYPDLPSNIAFYRKLLDGLRNLPGVESVGATNGVPLAGNITGAYVTVEGHPSTAVGNARPSAEAFAVSPDYLPTMGIELLTGRELTPHDGAGGLHPAMINDLAAQRFWAHEDPLGKRIGVNRDNGREVWRQVVGVVKTTHDQSIDSPAQPAVYLPMEQAFEPPQFLAVRTSLPIAAIAARLRQAVAAVDKDQPVFVVNAMQELLDNSIAPRRFAAVILALFGALALVLAAAGIYGVASYSVSRRTQEIGLRVALGAQRGDVLRLIVGQGMRLIVIGIVLGLAGAGAATRALASLLYGVGATDPATFLGVPLALAAVGLAACYIPARRAAKVDPAAVLRCE
ncbi:MAG: ABC transporter permease [Bryobacteraceae bacterium]|jgi:putative ABC transport system permease protein